LKNFQNAQKLPAMKLEKRIGEKIIIKDNDKKPLEQMFESDYKRRLKLNYKTLGLRNENLDYI
jgi:aspartyl-tRNA synthetase